VILVSWLSFRFIEQPFLRIKNKLEQKSASPAPTQLLPSANGGDNHAPNLVTIPRTVSCDQRRFVVPSEATRSRVACDTSYSSAE
jgi:hypothetical protein